MSYASKQWDFPEYEINGNSGKAEIVALLPHLSVNTESAILYECTEFWTLEPRTLPTSYWSWIKSGKGTVKIRNIPGVIKAEPGSFILFPAEWEHSFFPETGEEMKMVNVHFHAKFYDILDAPRLFRLAGKFPDTENNIGKRSLELCRIFQHKPPGWKQYMNNLVSIQLFELIYNFPAKINFTSGQARKLSRLQPALTHIERRLGEPDLNTGDIAASIHVSQVYLRKLFKDAFGQSPIQFVHGRRIQRACSLLRGSELRIKEIAAESGFNDIQFFYRIFRRLLGTTPAAYREAPDF